MKLKNVTIKADFERLEDMPYSWVTVNDKGVIEAFVDRPMLSDGRWVGDNSTNLGVVEVEAESIPDFMIGVYHNSYEFGIEFDLKAELVKKLKNLQAELEAFSE